MISLDIYKDKIQRLSTLTVITQEIYLYADYFHRPNSKNELELYNNKVIGSHLRFIRHLLYRNLIVELFKLFSTSSNDKLNLLKMIEEAHSFEHNPEIELSTDILNQFENDIKCQQDRIEVVKNLRHKLYAHTDLIKIEDYNLEISFMEICELVNIAKEVVRYLYVVFLNNDFLFYPRNFERDRFILFDLLIKGEKVRIDEIHRKYGFEPPE